MTNYMQQAQAITKNPETQIIIARHLYFSAKGAQAFNAIKGQVTDLNAWPQIAELVRPFASAITNEDAQASFWNGVGGALSTARQ
jgi:hypothetical protein